MEYITMSVFKMKDIFKTQQRKMKIFFVRMAEQTAIHTGGLIWP